MELPELYIKAISPGYKVGETQNVNEFIELARADPSSSSPILLANFTIGYTNSSGTAVTLLSFSENDWLVGETILLRLASSPESELANRTYSKTLALKAGPLTLSKNDEIIDSVCWDSSENCATEFRTKTPTFLVRNLETGVFEHIENYEPVFDSESLRVENTDEGKGASSASESESETETMPVVIEKQCENLIFSEIFTYYESSKSEQFIEFYNPTSEQISLSGCQIRYKNKLYNLDGVVKSDDYFAFYPDFNLTKDPSSSNLLELVDADDSVAASLTYYNGQKKNTSYALIGYDDSGQEIWKSTYDKTPGAANNYQQYKTCPEGKAINTETGNCVTVTVVEEKTCEAGKYLNPETGRCKAYEVEEEKTCADGYYLNPETNRCKKIQTNSGADYEIIAEDYSETSSFVAIYAIIIILALAIGYLIFQFRGEIKKFFGKVFRRFRKKPHL